MLPDLESAGRPGDPASAPGAVHTKRLEHVPLQEITRARVEAAMDEKRAEGIGGRSSKRLTRSVAPKTLDDYVCEIAKILNHACVLGWLNAVPPLSTKRCGSRRWCG